MSENNNPTFGVKAKVWLSIAAVFSAGALAVNAIWVYSYNEIDKRHVAQIDDLTTIYNERLALQNRSHKRAMGELRNRVEKKVDKVLEKLEKLPSTPIVIETRRELQGVKSD